MIPVRTDRSNAVYRGPSVDVGDAWVERTMIQVGEREVRAVYLDWHPTDEELELLLRGALLRVGIIGVEPIPPISLEVRADITVVDADPPPIHEEVPTDG